MTDYLNLSQDNYLLSKEMHSSKITRIVDFKNIDFSVPGPTEEDIKKTFDEKMIEEFSIRKLFEYDKVKEGDMVLYYSDMGVLSGSSGYILIRDGYVHRRRIVWRS